VRVERASSAMDPFEESFAPGIDSYSLRTLALWLRLAVPQDDGRAIRPTG